MDGAQGQGAKRKSKKHKKHAGAGATEAKPTIKAPSHKSSLTATAVAATPTPPPVAKAQGKAGGKPHRWAMTETRVIAILACGILLGALLTWAYIAKPSLDSEMLHAYFGPGFAFTNLSLADLTTVIPGWNAGLMPLDEGLPLSERPGRQLAAQGTKAKHPVFLVPGIVSTGLELWQGEECAKKYFRQRMWGTFKMVETLILDRACWARHMSLDPVTGLDPPGIKLRPAHGLEAADYLFPGFWVWARVIENLGDLGYDTNNVYLASYDWRLSPVNLQRRDRYFSRLKLQIEEAVSATGEKAVVMTHSMGSNVFLYFMKWVESPLGGNGGNRWNDKHIDSFVNIGGPMLGCTKAVSSVTSGEMRDTAQLGALQPIVERFMSAAQRRSLFRRWGGDAIWGSINSAPDDVPGQASFGPLLSFKNGNLGFTAGKVTEFMLADNDTDWTNQLRNWYSFGVNPDPEAQTAPQTWTNALEMELPYAPNMKIYCLYGIGKSTERGYWYSNNSARTSPNDPEYLLDTTITDLVGGVSYGVRESDGDGTVPLVSLGYIHNPSGMRVVTREYKHTVLSFMQAVTGMEARGGSNTADHVDILGNRQLTEDVLNIAAGNPIDDVIYSNIREISSRVKLPS